MKNTYIKSSFIRTKLCMLTGILLLIGNSYIANCQVRKSFTQRTSQFSPTTKIYNIKGDFTMIGNTNMTLQSYSDTKNNGSSNTMIKVDKDADATTNNSSSADLSFSNENGASSTCTKVLFAGLYWTGRTASTVTTSDKQKVKIKCPGMTSYQQLTANAADIQYPGDNDIFVAYTEVTSLVRQYGLGTYWVADISLSTGSQDAIGWSGGWGMVVVYENSAMNPRDITIFDGYAFVASSTTVNYDLPITGFNTALTGAVNMKLGLIASEGDVSYTGDYFRIKKNSDGAWLILNHPNNSGTTTTDYTNNFFSSTIYTGGNTRNPNLVNNTGIDINMFNITNTNNQVIGNNQTSTTFNYGSTTDTYSIFCIAMGVDAYKPVPEGIISMTSPTGIVSPCTNVDYKVEIRNKGTEALNNTKIIIPLPYTATNYISSSKTVYAPASTTTSPYYDPSLGATGSIVWDFGTLPKPSDPNTLLATLTFRLGVSCDCNVLRSFGCPSADITINGSISGTGASTNIAANNSFILGYSTNGSCTGNAISGPITTSIDATAWINSNCQGDPIREFTYCNTTSTIPITDVSGFFPLGSRIYNEYPITETSIEYNVSNPFPATVGSITYYAYPPGTTTCYYKFNITVSSITTLPTVSGSPLTYCQNGNASALTATASNSSYSLFYYTSNTTSATPQLSIIPQTTTPGTYTYYVAEGKSAACISPNKAPITVIINPLPSTPTTVNTDRDNFCPSDEGNIKLTSAGGSGNIIQWYSNSCGETSIGTGSPLIIASPESTTAYFVRWENSCGNSTCANLTVTVKDQENPTIICPTDVTVHADHGECTASNITLGTPVTNDNCKVKSVINDSPVQFNQGTTNITWTVTDYAGNKNTCIQKVTVENSITASISSISNVSCAGGNNGTATASTTSDSAPVSYIWNTNPQQTTATANNLKAGTYTVTVTDKCGNTNTAEAIIKEPYPLTVDLSISYSRPDIQPIGVKGCNDATITFTLPKPAIQDTIINFTIGGTAVNGKDYEQINNSIVIPAGAKSNSIILIPFLIGIKSGDLTFSITLTVASCIEKTYTIDIKENL